tara:strand:- start:183 stop:1289 length:1107 start_codon:yes stop_codon:yes gene_type:complete
MKKIKFVDLKAQYKKYKREIDISIKACVEKSDFISGDSVREFEKKFKNKLNSKYCLTTNNGTDSLFIAMKALNIQKGQEVITSAHSWISSSSQITQAGGIPVFCDTEPGTFNIDVKKLKMKINNKTAGIIAVHLYGQPCDILDIVTIAKKKKIWVIEDCAQAHFAKYKNKYVGTFGDFGCFSFFPSKNLGAYGDGGAIITNNNKLYKSAYMFSKHGGFKKNEHLIEGINSRMDGIQGAVLNVKLKYIDKFNTKRNNIAKLYHKFLKNIGDLKLPQIKQNRNHVFHLYVVRTKKRDELRKYLLSNNIASSIHYPSSLPMLPAYKKYKFNKKDFKDSIYNQKEILSLPIYPELKKDEVKYICKKIKLFFS